MKQSPSWAANQFSASQEIPHILRNPQVHYRVYKCPPPVHILSQLDPFHALTSHCPKIHLNIILPTSPGLSKWSFSQRFSHRNPPYTSHLPHMPHQSHSYRFDHPINTGEERRSLSSSLYNFLHSPATSSLLGPNILLNTLFSNILSLRSSLNVSDQVLHLYKTTGNIIVKGHNQQW